MLILFDIGGTLLDCKIHPIKQLSERLKLTDEEKNKLKELIFTTSYTRGVKELIPKIEELLRINLSIEDEAFLLRLTFEQVHHSYPVDGALNFCAKITKLGIPYGFVSNIWKPFKTGFNFHFNKFANKANYKFFSDEMGIKKPHPLFYEKVFASLDSRHKKDKIVVIGDNLKNDIIPFIERNCFSILYKPEHLYINEDFSLSIPECWNSTIHNYPFVKKAIDFTEAYDHLIKLI